MITTHEAVQALLQQSREPLDKAMQTLQGELGALAGAVENEGSEEESYVLGIYNEAFELRLQVKAFFETWLDK
ncbi:hypothetical protein [Kribbella sp. NBC_00889]|uniref:hypothetical protein n=1 Tax=Kribbella sp. NBC_00889 TaxID=2975974 RepID=UPI00386B7EFF|nr:hypothetical protein OG817_01035 [Kribbella sp. NBC_00889]